MGFSTETHMLERVATGKVPGASLLDIAGYNSNVGSAIETLWSNSNAYTFLTTNMSSPTIVSSSANDTAAGTGARTVRITGVNASYVAQAETITLNGATPVSLVNSYMTINSITVLTAGSGGVTAGNLTLAAGGVTHGYVAAGYNVANSMIYCVPASFSLLVTTLHIANLAASAGGNVAQIAYSTNGAVSLTKGLFGWATNMFFEKDFRRPLYFPAKTQIQVQVSATGTAGVMSGYLGGILLDQSITTYSTWM